MMATTQSGDKMLTLIDMFSGAGGTSLGFKNAGFEILAALDTDKDATETYEKNFGIEPLKYDISKISGRDLLKETGLSRGELIVLAGCPPCQGFTSLRPGCVDDPRNDLVKSYSDVIKDAFPEFVVFENVSGILSPKNKSYFAVLLNALRKNGYDYVYDVLNTFKYGVPQFRRRAVLIGARKKEHRKNLRLPVETHSAPRMAEKKSLRPWVTVGEAFEGVHPLRAGQKSKTLPNHVASSHEERIMDIIRSIPKNGGSRMDLPADMWLECHKKHDGHTDVYGRMSYDRPSPCITAGFMSPSKGRFIHPTQNRAITAREAAKLQTFPDDFVFHGNFSSWGPQIGNAMPPLLVEIVARVVSEIKSAD